MRVSHFVFWMPLLFLLLYLEPLYVGALKFSYLWKIAFLGLLASALILRFAQHKGRMPWNIGKGASFVGIWAAWALYPAIHLLWTDHPFEQVVYVGLRWMPLIVIVYLASMPKTPHALYAFPRALVWFLVLSSIPFLAGVLQPLGDAYNLAGVGDEESVGAFIGIFQKAHNAGLTIMIGAVIAMALAMRFKGVNAYLYWLAGCFLVGVGLLTYVRSSMTLFLAAAVFYFMFYAKAAQRAKFLVVGIAVALFLAIFVLDLDAFTERLLGQNKWHSEVNAKVLSSGRVDLWAAAFSYYSDFEPWRWLVGGGQFDNMDRMLIYYGRRLIPHNGYIDELVSNGLIGFSLLLMLMRSLWKSTDNLDEFSRGLMKSLYVGFAVFGFTQSFDYPIVLSALLIIHVLALHYRHQSISQPGVFRGSNAGVDAMQASG